MDINSLIALVVAFAAIYFFIKFIVSPLLRIIFGIIIFLAAIYFLQRFFGFNFDQLLAPLHLSWILKPIDFCINQIKNLIK